MATMTALQAHERIVAASTKPAKEVRRFATMAVGDSARQGDCYFLRISAPADWKPTADRQLAPGVSRGSRHIVTSKSTVLANPEPGRVERVRIRGRICARIAGPQITGTERVVVEHPEHAWLDMPPGHYQVYYQVDQRTQRAVRD